MLQTDTSILKLNTDLIIPNKYQPRKIFDEKELNSLAESIQNYGIINPILVRKKDDKYEIIAGERRYRAAKKIGLTEVPVIVKDANEQEMAELALIENLERAGLNPIEEAKSCEEIMKIGNYTQATLANKIGKSQSAIANKIRLLSLPKEVQEALLNRKIGERHARCLLNVETKEKQLEVLEKIIKEKLTVKETEQIIKIKEPAEDEIKQAISDIMKSLNITDDSDTTEKEKTEDKKEEKEDDNMNNGNFFPNFDNNNVMNNNASLNMMNAQSMNQAPMQAAPEMVMPTMVQPTPEPQLIAPTPAINIEPQMPTAPTMNEMPQFGPTLSSPILEVPTMDMNNNIPSIEPVVNAPVNNEMPLQPTMNEIPQFGPTLSVPTPETQISVPEITPVVPDTPLFNQEVVMPTVEPTLTVPTPENIGMTPNPYEIPVMPSVVSPIEPMPLNENKLTELENLLNSNGFTYKVYNNDNEHCIIVELPKN